MSIYILLTWNTWEFHIPPIFFIWNLIRIGFSDTILISRFAGVLCTDLGKLVFFNNFVILPEKLENHPNLYFHEYYRRFLFRRPPHWISHFQFWKSDNGFIISDPKNPRILSPILSWFVFSAATILNPPFLILKTW